MKKKEVDYLHAVCVVITLVSVAIIAVIGFRACRGLSEPSDYQAPEQFHLYEADTISARDSVVKEVPKEKAKAQLPASSSSSKRSSYRSNDNMQRFDPPSEDDMDDNGMSRYMNAYDDEDWE